MLKHTWAGTAMGSDWPAIPATVKAPKPLVSRCSLATSNRVLFCTGKAPKALSLLVCLRNSTCDAARPGKGSGRRCCASDCWQVVLACRRALLEAWTGQIEFTNAVTAPKAWALPLIAGQGDAAWRLCGQATGHLLSDLPCCGMGFASSHMRANHQGSQLVTARQLVKLTP